MAGFIFVLILLAVAAAIAVPIVVVSMRRQARERKNYERGLKMVPLLIHLPPISEDSDLNGRDVRDLMDENISKAQIVYNIIASTYEKGLKRKLVYGQQHFAFEVLSAKGFVYFYTTVPIGLVEVVRQAVVSAYPSARLEEAEEHNIFNPLSKLSGVIGGELVLKEPFAYPIATYLDTRRDAMQALLNALSTLNKEEGAAIQILLRPADPGWRKAAHTIASSKRKGEDASGGAAAKVGGTLKEVGMAFVKPPEGKEKEGGSDKKELSQLEQQVLDSIDDKTRYPGYETLIRVVVSSNISQRSQAILNNIVASFSLFDAPGKNGFKFEPAKDMNEFVTSYIMKFFPQTQTKTILNSIELATIFHFPDQRSIPTSQLERQDSKQVDGPRNMPDDGLLLGYNVFRGVKKPIRLAIGDRQRHMYVVGQTGTGKSTFLENLALQDMIDGNGFAFVDPHGDTAEKLLAMVPKERTEDVIYFCPADMDYPMGVNLFEFDNPDQKDFLIQEALNMLKKLYDPNNQGIMGPRYEHLFRNAALTVMADPAGGTFIDIPKLFRDPQYVKQKLEYVKDLNVLEFWQKEMPQSQRSNEFGEVVSWFVSKFGAFLSNEMMRNIIGQTQSSFNLRDIMDNKKILLVNLSKGRTGDLNSKLLGMIFVMKFQAAAMSRANIPEKERVDFSLYVDEFQNFSTDSFATIMSEARKYRLNLIVANQFTTQLSEEIRDAVFGNMGTIVAFRIGQNDVDSLSRYFQPVFDGDDLLRVPNYNSIVRTLVGGVPTQPFSMAALPPLGDPNPKLADALKQLSAAKFGRAKAAVEKDIFERIATKDQGVPPAGAPGAPGARPFGAAAGSAPAPWGTPPAPAAAGGFGRSPFGQPGAAAPAAGYGPQPGYGQPAPAPRPAANASFLDDWLTKRGAPAAGQPLAPTPIPQPPAPAAAPAQPAAPSPMPAALADGQPAVSGPPPAVAGLSAADLPHTPQPMVIDHSATASPDGGPAAAVVDRQQGGDGVAAQAPTEATTDDSPADGETEVSDALAAAADSLAAGQPGDEAAGRKRKRKRNRNRKNKDDNPDGMPRTPEPHAGMRRIEPIHADINAGKKGDDLVALAEAEAEGLPKLEPRVVDPAAEAQPIAFDPAPLQEVRPSDGPDPMPVGTADLAATQDRPAPPPPAIGQTDTQAGDDISGQAPIAAPEPVPAPSAPAPASADIGLAAIPTDPQPPATMPAEPAADIPSLRQPKDGEKHFEEGDTIYIDKDGHLKMVDESAGQAAK